MLPELQKLCDVDQLISLQIKNIEINAEEIIVLVDKREQILQKALYQLEIHPELKATKQWQDAIIRTKHLVELMQSETSQIGKMLHKYRHGNKSVQQYKKFL